MPQSTTFTAVVDSPLSVRLNWDVPQPCVDSQGVACTGFKLLVQDLEYTLGGYFLPNISFDANSLLLDNENAKSLDADVFYGAEALPVLELRAGQKLSFHLWVNGQTKPVAETCDGVCTCDWVRDAWEPACSGAGTCKCQTEQSHQLQSTPKEVNIVDQCGPPLNVVLCEIFHSSGLCATEPAADRSVRVIWRRPSEVGNGLSNVQVPILVYETQVSPVGDWNSEHLRTTNFSVAEGDELNSEGLHTVTDLTKGDLVAARVRAYTFVGPGQWSNTSAPVTVISYPTSPTITLAASSTEEESFIEVDWEPPADTGDLRNDTVPIIDYQIQFSEDSAFPASASRTVTLAGTPDYDYRWNDENSGVQLTLGNTYYSRVRARNIIGYSPFTEQRPILFVKRASIPLNVHASAYRPLSLNVSWDEPVSRGAQDGVFVPLLGFDVFISIGADPAGVPSERGEPLILSETRTLVRHPDSGNAQQFILLSNLTKGSLYYVYIRARNTAFENGGNGDWSAPALTTCADGNARRPEVCGVAAVTALDTPSMPLNFSMKSVGFSKLMASWDQPADTGTGTSAYPLMRYDFDYETLGSESGSPSRSQILGSDLTYTTPELTLGVIYRGRLRAVNDADESVWTAYAQARALLLPDPPTNVRADNYGNLAIRVRWTRPSQTGLGLGNEWTMINYQIKVTSTCHDEREADLPENQTSVIFADMLEGCWYKFRVRGQNDGGYGGFRNSSEVQGLSLPTQVRNFRAAADLALRVRLDWDAPSNTGDGTSSPANIHAYEIEVVEGTIGTANFSNAFRRYSVQTSGLNVTLLNLGVLYSFRIRSINSAGSGVANFQSQIPIIPALQKVSISPSSNLSGANISLLVRLTLSSSLDVNDQIVITFPNNFSIQAAKVSQQSSDLIITSTSDGTKPCGYRCQPSENDFFISRDGAEEIMPAGKIIEFSLTGVINRMWEGFSGNFQVRTIDLLGYHTIDHDLNVSGYFLEAGTFSDVSSSLDHRSTGKITTLQITLRSPRNPIPQRAMFVLTVKSGMIVKDMSSLVLSCRGVEETMIFSVNGVNVTGLRDGQAIPRDTECQIKVTGIRNRITQGESGTFVVKMMTSFGAVMDASPNVASIHISAGKLVDGGIVLDEYRALAKTRYTFTFKLASVGLPVKSRVEFKFPVDIRLEEALFEDTGKQGVDGSFMQSRHGQTVSIQRKDGSETAPNSAVSFSFASVRNFYAGASGNFSIQTISTINGVVMEEMHNITSNDFVPGQLVVEHFSLSDYFTGSTVTMTWIVRTNGPFNLDGEQGDKFVLILPPGFEYSSRSEFTSDQPLLVNQRTGVASSNCMNKTWIACQTITIELPKGNGGEFPAWPSLTRVQMTFAGLLNTPLNSTAFMHISTQSAAGRVLDLNTDTLVRIYPRQVTAVFTPSSALANMTGSYEIEVTGFNRLPPECILVFGFPDAVTFPGNVGFSSNLIGNTTMVLEKRFSYDVRSSRNPPQGLDISGTAKIFRRGELLSQNRQMKFNFFPVWHRETSGPTEPFFYSLQTLDGVVIESNTNVPGLYLKYAKPKIYAISSVNGPGTGMLTIAVTGKNFGPVEENTRIGGDKRSISFGGTHSVLTRWMSDTSIICILSPGIALAPVDMSITIEGQKNSTKFSYNEPELNAQNVAAGGDTVTIFLGSNFGQFDLSPTLRVGFSSCESTIWVSDSSIPVKTASSAGMTHRTSISVSNGILSSVAGVSYDLTLVLAVDKTLGESVYFESARPFYAPQELKGLNFGSASFTTDARMGRSGCEVTLWVSDSALRCTPAAGVGSSWSVIATAGASSGSITEAFSYPAVPSIEGHAQSNVPSLGGVVINIGARFILNSDYTVRVRHGDTTCTSTEWTSFSSIQCGTPAGRGDLLALVLTSSAETGTVSQLMTYDWTQLMSAVDKHDRALNMPTSGNHALTMMGLDFGTFSTSPALRFGLTSAEESAWLSDSSVYAMVASGVGGTHAAKISVLLMQQDGRLTGIASYNVPQVFAARHSFERDSIDKDDAVSYRENSPLRTVKAYQFHGQHLGYSDYTLMMRAGNSECQRSSWISVTSVNCRMTAGHSATHNLVATLAFAASTATQVVSYDVAALSSFSISNVAVLTHEQICLHGLNFGFSSISQTIRAGISAGESTTWNSESSMRCNSAKGAGGTLQVSVTCGQNVGSVSNVVSYDNPRVLVFVHGTNCPSDKPKRIVSIPLNIPRGFSPGFRTGFTAAESTTWLTSTHVSCQAGAGVGRDLTLVVTIGEQAGTSKGMFSYDDASLFFANGTNYTVNGAAAGGMEVMWTGYSFGPGVNTITARLGRSQCAASLWISDSAVSCKDSSGFSGPPQAMVVSVSGTKQSMTNVFSYDAPKVTDMKAKADSTSSEILLNGINFGFNDVTLAAVIGTAGCRGTSWQSDTSLQCSLRAGYTFSNVPAVSMSDILVCKKCKANEVIVGCSSSSAGHCGVCEPCNPGSFRFGCVPGTASSGECKQCPTDGPVHQRQFKAERGTALTQCEICAICGGPNQDGTAYEELRCTATSNTICRPCAPCTAGIRIGCAGPSAGKCTSLENGKISRVLANAAQELLVNQTGPTTFVAIGDNVVSLTGDFAGTGVTIQSGTMITLPPGSNATRRKGTFGTGKLSVIVVATAMTKEMQQEARDRNLRSLSNLTYYDITGTQFDPPVRLNLRFNNGTGNSDTRLAAFRWNSGNMSWTELESTVSTTSELQVINVVTAHFSAFAVFETDTPANKLLFTDLRILIPVAVISAIILCAVMVALYRKYRRPVNGQSENAMTRKSENSEPTAFMLETDTGPVLLEVTGEAHDGRARSLILQQSPLNAKQKPTAASGPSTKDFQTDRTSLLQSPYGGIGMGAPESRPAGGLSPLPPLSVPFTPKLRAAGGGQLSQPSTEFSRRQSVPRVSEERLASYLRPTVPPRDDADPGMPSTDLAMLAMGISVPTKASTESTWARSKDSFGTNSASFEVAEATSPDSLPAAGKKSKWSSGLSVFSRKGQKVPGAQADKRAGPEAQRESNLDFEKSLSLLAKGFSTPLRSVAHESGMSANGKPISSKYGRAYDVTQPPAHLRAWAQAPDTSSPRPRGLDAYRQVPHSFSPDATYDDDVFGHEAQHSARNLNVEDVILSVGHDFIPQPSSSRGAQDDLHEVEDAEFSIQPGARRFLSSDTDDPQS